MLIFFDKCAFPFAIHTSLHAKSKENFKLKKKVRSEFLASRSKHVVSYVTNKLMILIDNYQFKVKEIIMVLLSILYWKLKLLSTCVL